jgi:D-alanyl-D-alanine carboxypeptidase
MNSKFIVKLAMSTFAVGVSTLVPSHIGISNAATATPAEVAAKKAHKMALKAEKQFQKGRVDTALTLAELAVEGDPQNREYRSLLSRIYMTQGRFQSAERTLMDVMELGQVDGRTVISLALVRIAQGHTGSAIALVDANQSLIPASDYGLALALAGQPERAIDVLGAAIRADNANARTRQNLALAYAIGGRWREARVMASQDMPEPQVNESIAEWAQYARPGAYELRVAGLLNVTPQEDAGQPVRLALNNAAAPAVMALAMPEPPAPVSAPEPAPVAVAAAVASSELAAIGPAPMAEDKGFEVAAQTEAAVAMPAAMAPAVAVASAEEAPLIKAETGPTKTQIIFQRFAQRPMPPMSTKVAAAKRAVKAKPVKLALADTSVKPTSPRQVSGRHLVQLGAYTSVESAQAAWNKLSNRYSILKGTVSASSKVTVNGKEYIRLAAMGFGNLETATVACQSIKAQGGACIVRNTSGEQQTVRLASRKAGARKAVRIASR